MFPKKNPNIFRPITVIVL